MNEISGRYSVEIEALIRQIDLAFGQLPIPPADRIVDDPMDYDLERTEIRAKFQGRDWRDLTIDDLAGEAYSLCFFTVEAFRYFLPAFMRASLVDPVRADLIPQILLGSLAGPDLEAFWAQHKDSLLSTMSERGVPEAVMLELAPRASPRADAACKARIATLSHDQKVAILGFVGFLRKHRGGDFALGELEAVEKALSP